MKPTSRSAVPLFAQVSNAADSQRATTRPIVGVPSEVSEAMNICDSAPSSTGENLRFMYTTWTFSMDPADEPASKQTIANTESAILSDVCLRLRQFGKSVRSTAALQLHHDFLSSFHLTLKR